MSFDLQTVKDRDDFYRQFAGTFALKEFGANLDALWDVLTAGVPLPLQVTLYNLHQHPRRALFQPVLQVMQEAGQETRGAFSVRVY